MTPQAAELERLSTLSQRQIDALARDPHQPAALRAAARDALSALSANALKAAISDFERATPVFADFARRLSAIASTARGGPADHAVAALHRTISDLSGAYAAIGDMIRDPAAQAEALGKVEAVRSGLTAGKVSRATDFGKITAEYIAMFDAAAIQPARAVEVDRVRARISANRPLYDAVAGETGVPWFITGAIHGLEASFRTDRHLHNGDPLSARTSRVPAGRPAADVGNPPFAWPVSAADALRGHRLHLIDSWTLPRMLYELERFNGFGYRYRRVASPYLWAGSSMYTGGKYVADGKYDAKAVSKQIGGAVVLKALIKSGDIPTPT